MKSSQAVGSCICIGKDIFTNKLLSSSGQQSTFIATAGFAVSSDQSMSCNILQGQKTAHYL